MARRAMFKTLVACAALAVAGSILPGCAAKKAVPAEPEAMTLAYRLAQGTPVTYRTSQSSNQTLTIMNQYMNVLTTKDIVFTLTPGEVVDGKQSLVVTIDSLEASITSPQGEFTADAAAALGKSFTMMLSALGEETDLVGADVITYSAGSAGEQSVKADFLSIFPNVAGAPVKIGDTWTTQDTVDIDQSGMKIQMISTNVNTFEGLETIAGMECIRVGAVTSGTVTGGGEQQGAQVVIESTSSGNDTWFFAHKGGMLAKLVSETSVAGTVKVGGEQGMAIPMKQTMSTETAFVR